VTNGTGITLLTADSCAACATHDACRSPDDFYRIGALYAIWDSLNQIIGEYVGHHAGYDLPEFRPLIWDGPDAELGRTVCAGPRARVRAIADQADRASID